jgi:hypothetical protein
MESLAAGRCAADAPISDSAQAKGKSSSNSVPLLLRSLLG